MKKLLLIFAIILMACETKENIEDYPPEHYNVEGRKEKMLQRINGVKGESQLLEKPLCAGINQGKFTTAYEVFHCCNGCGQWLIGEINFDGEYIETYIGGWEDAQEACDIMEQ